MAKVFENYTEDKSTPNVAIATVRSDVLKKRFLDAYLNIGSIAKTCQLLGLCRRTFYHWKEGDEEFAKQFLIADQMALGLLEDEAHLRAVYGIDKPVYQAGRLVGYTKEYSDTLLVLLLKARAPHKYKDRFAGEFTGADGKPLNGGMKIIHVHSNVPMAETEDTIDMTKRIEDIPHTPVTNDDIDELLS